MPKFQHDCSNCVFVGHFFGNDVYTCKGSEGPMGTSIVARDGNNGPEYTSMPVKLFRDMFADPTHKIGGESMPTMSFQEYLFSPYATAYQKAWLLGLASV